MIKKWADLFKHGGESVADDTAVDGRESVADDTAVDGRESVADDPAVDDYQEQQLKKKSTQSMILCCKNDILKCVKLVRCWEFQLNGRAIP